MRLSSAPQRVDVTSSTGFPQQKDFYSIVLWPTQHEDGQSFCRNSIKKPTTLKIVIYIVLFNQTLSLLVAVRFRHYWQVLTIYLGRGGGIRTHSARKQRVYSPPQLSNSSAPLYKKYVIRGKAIALLSGSGRTSAVRYYCRLSREAQRWTHLIFTHGTGDGTRTRTLCSRGFSYYSMSP